MKLKESLTTDEQKFISKLIDELDIYDFIDWDKSEDSIYLFPEKLDEFNEKYREEIPEKYFNVLSRCLHPETRQQTAVKSNGVYSVLRDEWIKEPVAEDIPEINEEEFEKLFKEWEDKYFALLDEVK